ncbi:1-aminocyclopropane-1-carboxylate synthase-like protein 1 [Gigantopelta aegis]|uniref:1-aminocyclopropane-1-carboxylate synthase-like protein 1 n=1 Tax=Gigantopelta aegis TaxID=1735272 RepID=UPI001B8897A5|nr:1-aminocyclopropane-1-carboxylate synthase-like protein 1 [Gigantopelta aegis]
MSTTMVTLMTIMWGSSSSSQSVSERCLDVLSIPSVLVKYGQKVHGDPYHPELNPDGIVDLGTAENKVCEEMLSQKLTDLKVEKEDTIQLYYPDLKGIISFRRRLKVFLQEMFNSVNEINTEELVVMNGTTSILEVLAYCLAERGDCFLVPSPYYYRIKNDFEERAGIVCYEIPLYSSKIAGKSFQLSGSALETAYRQAKDEGKSVKGVVLINPHNPLGDVYSKSDLHRFLLFAAQHQLHVILDEIYALSVFDEQTTFSSVLSLSVPDPQRTHFIWGFSKDLGLSGYRCGVLYSRNKDVIRYATQVAIYHLTPPLVQLKLEKLITDIGKSHPHPA